MKTARTQKLKRITTIFCAVVAALVFFQSANVRAEDAATLSSLLGQIKAVSESSADSTLKSLGGELGTKAQSLGGALAGNAGMQGLLTGALQPLLGNKGPEALAAFQKLSEAKLTPEQMSLAKDVGHVGSAYLVQKNLGGLEGSQANVAQIVTSLRKGNVTAALPAIRKVSGNTKLTPAQKELLSSMADKFAPGAKKAGAAIEGGIKSIPGFGK